MDNGPALLMLIVVFVLYFIPVCVALSNNHRQTVAIVILNLFLGWTLLGWVGALVWACTKPALATAPSPEGVTHA